MYQRIMIFGDSASGKSTFSVKLSKALGLPLIHADELMNEIGRTDSANIAKRIQDEANKEDWIIEGNAFTKDKSMRIERATVIYAFDFNRFSALYNHVRRHFKVSTGKEMRTGNNHHALNLRYFIPYILLKFPPRKQAAMELAKSLNKISLFFMTTKILF